nr:integrase, catalytic region, zinc finger, CCHC-type, peptidase aspartic, catalytic [Tanacetum cinerariifolium]
MANLSEDIQCAGSDNRPPMLDRSDFTLWQQHIRMYCRGKENGVNILKLIDEGPFQMGIVRKPLTEGTKGAPHLGPERPRVYSNLSLEEKHGRGTNLQGGGAAGYGGVQNRVENANLDPVTDEAGPSYDSDILSEYVKDNAVPGVHSNVSSVPNDAYMEIYNDMYKPHAQFVSKT